MKTKAIVWGLLCIVSFATVLGGTFSILNQANIGKEVEILDFFLQLPTPTWVFLSSLYVTVRALQGRESRGDIGIVLSGFVLLMMVCGTIANKRDLKRRLVIPNSTNNAAFPYYTHVVYPGETIKDIARQYDVSAESIRKANQIENDDYIKLGEKLIVPTEN